MRPLLVADVGNTSALFALFQNGRFKNRLRLSTHRLKRQGLARLKSRFKRSGIEAAVIASVVPWAGNYLKKNIPRCLGFKAYLIGRDLQVPMPNRYRNPRQVGMDRLMNALAAYRRYRRALVIVDFGTAITLDVVSEKGEYLGGVIAPGIEISLEALFQKTALLPRIRLLHPSHVIAKDTVESIRVGCSVGIGGLCDRLVERIRKRLRRKPLVVATGGYADFMARYSEKIDRIDADLVLKGIVLTYLHRFAPNGISGKKSS